MESRPRTKAVVVFFTPITLAAGKPSKRVGGPRQERAWTTSLQTNTKISPSPFGPSRSGREHELSRTGDRARFPGFNQGPSVLPLTFDQEPGSYRLVDGGTANSMRLQIGWSQGFWTLSKTKENWVAGACNHRNLVLFGSVLIDPTVRSGTSRICGSDSTTAVTSHSDKFWLSPMRQSRSGK